MNRSLYIIWLLEEITNNSNKYCIFGLTFQSPLSKHGLVKKTDYVVKISEIDGKYFRLL